MVTPEILAFAGSTRTESYNKKLVRLAADAARAAGANVTVIDLRDLPLPLFDEDFETAHGLPENAKKLKSLMKEHDGFLISSPEYNSSITAVLKNAIDWASRPETEDEPPRRQGRQEERQTLACQGLLEKGPASLRVQASVRERQLSFQDRMPL